MTVPFSMLRPSLRTSTGYMSTGIWLPFQMATPTTKESSPTPLTRLFASRSSSTRSTRLPAARSMPLSRNNESKVTCPLANSCAMPDGCACVRSSWALSCVTSSSGDGARPRRYSSRHPRIRSNAVAVSSFSLIYRLTSLLPCGIPHIPDCVPKPHRCLGCPMRPTTRTGHHIGMGSWRGTATVPDDAPSGTAL